MQNRSMTDAYMLRLPDGWRDAIKARAARNRRSMNSEILAALDGVVSEATAGASLQADTPAVAQNHAALAGGATINP